MSPRDSMGDSHSEFSNWTAGTGPEQAPDQQDDGLNDPGQIEAEIASLSQLIEKSAYQSPIADQKLDALRQRKLDGKKAKIEALRARLGQITKQEVAKQQEARLASIEAVKAAGIQERAQRMSLNYSETEAEIAKINDLIPVLMEKQAGARTIQQRLIGVEIAKQERFRIEYLEHLTALEAAEKTEQTKKIISLKEEITEADALISDYVNKRDKAAASSINRRLMDIEVKKYTQLKTERIRELAALEGSVVENSETGAATETATAEEPIAEAEVNPAELEKQARLDVKAELSGLTSLGFQPAELQRLLLTDEVINNLLARGYQPGQGKNNAEILVVVLDGKLNAAEEILQYKFPDVRFENGEPIIGLWGRMFGKKKKIVNSEDYQIFRDLLDLKNHILAEPEKLLPQTVEAPVKIPVKSRASSPILRNTALAAGVAAVSTMSGTEAKKLEQPNNFKEPAAEISYRPGEHTPDRRPGYSEATDTPPMLNNGIDSEQPAPKKSQADNLNKQILFGQGLPVVSPETQAQIDHAFDGAEDFKPFPDETVTRWNEFPATPSMDTQPVSRFDESKARKSKKGGQSIDFSPVEPSDELKESLDNAFVGGPKIDLQADGRIFDQGPAKPSTKTHAAGELNEKSGPFTSKQLLDFSPIEPDEETEEKIAQAFVGKPTIDLQAEGRIFDQGPKKPSTKSKPVDRRSTKEVLTSLGLDTTQSEPPEHAMIQESLSPTLYKSLTRRLQKLGLSSPEQRRILLRVVKQTSTMSPEMKASTLGAVLKMDYKKLKQTFRDATNQDS